jgi:hypothetical protein
MSRRALLGVALGLAAFAYLLAWPPTLNPADESFLLYGAKRVWQGQALYHDFFDFLTPGSFYLYALAYAVGGVSITSARVTTALVNTLAVVCTYALTLLVATTGEALLAGMLVAVICVPIWSMASHHWLATAFGLASAAILLAPRWASSVRARPFGAGALAGLLVSTHQGRGLPQILWMLMAVGLSLFGREGRVDCRRYVRELLWVALGGAAVCVPVFGYAIWRSSIHELVYATHTWVLSNYRRYNVGWSPWAAYGPLWQDVLSYGSLRFFEAIPALLLIEGVTLGWVVARVGLATQWVRLAVLLLAISAVAGIVYFPDVVHVAFIAPFALVVAGGMIHRLRAALPDAPVVNVVVRVGWAMALAVVLAKGWFNVRLAWERRPVRFETAFGTLAGTAPGVALLDELRTTLLTDPTTPAHVLAYTTDAWLYLALPAENPTRFALLRPIYNSPEQYEEVIDQLERDPRARVAVNALTVGPGDPLVAHLETSWRRVRDLGLPTFPGVPLWRIYEQAPAAEVTGRGGPS